MRELPANWTEVTLGEIGSWRGGGTPSKAKPEFWTNGTIPWVSPKDMKVSKLETAQDFITEAAVADSATNLIEAGSVMLVTRSGILSHSLPVAINMVPVALNQDIKAVTSHAVTDAAFLRLTFECFEREILNNCRKGGTTVHSIEFPALQAFRIPLPPLAEQKRIVAKIEELFSELDAGEESLRRTRRQLGVYRQSLLKQAFEGKLTAPWRAQHPDLLSSPDQLLARIQAERQARYQQQLKEWERAGGGRGKPRTPRKGTSEPISEDEIVTLPDLPDRWSWIRCSELFENVAASGIKIPQGEYLEDGYYPIVDQGATFIGGYTNDPTRLVPEDPPLIVFGDHTRVVKLLRQKFAPGADGTKILKTFPSVFCDYLTHFLRYAFAKDLGRGYSRHFQYMQKMPVPLPSLPEQQEIVRLLDEQFEEIEQNAWEIDAALKRSEALRQSILRKAFTGQLVPQDPADEPASALLERIRAQQEGKPTKKLKRSDRSVRSEESD